MATNGYGVKRMVTASPVSSEPVGAVVVPPVGKVVTLAWTARGSNGAVIANAPTRVWWTDSLSLPWQIAVTNTTTNRLQFYSTNRQLFFKLQNI